MAQIFDKGNAEPKRTLIFYIEVTDEGTTQGTALRQFAFVRAIREIAASPPVLAFGDCRQLRASGELPCG
jgi:hypothetical protein